MSTYALERLQAARSQYQPQPYQPPRPVVYNLPRDASGKLRVELPGPQPTVEAERLYRKQRLAASFRLFARYEFDHGGAGHITARDPQWTDHFWVNPAGVHFSHIRVSDLLLVNHQGDIVEGDGLLNPAAFAIHSQIHKVRTDVISAAHSHALYGKAFSAQGRLLDPLTQDSCAFYGHHVLFDDFTGVVLELSEGERIARALGPHRAAILRNHGLLTVGASVDAAVWRYITMENAARAQLLSEAAGPTRPIPHDVASHTAEQMGSETISWYAFQSLWDLITRQQPDLLD
jgi:ribulose-5-phosphate 4-epimerase/fuculose-1-phosphate aldolase